MKNWWILGIIALILLLWGVREGFDTYADALKDVGQTAGYTSLTPKCPEGSSLNATKTSCVFADTTKASVVPTCSSDTLEFVGGACVPKTPVGMTTSGTGTSMSTTTPSTTTGATTTGGSTTTTGTTTTTGGSTTTTGANASGITTTTGIPAPSDIKAGRQNVFGPVFTGRKETGGDGKGRPDSYKSNTYPELIGGGGPKDNGKTTLPNCEGLGCTENSIYFPYSRQPGDMDLIPDPYRVSQQFMTSSYSFKTEPTPFLTDFSAFQR